MSLNLRLNELKGEIAAIKSELTLESSGEAEGGDKAGADETGSEAVEQRISTVPMVVNTRDLILAIESTVEQTALSPSDAEITRATEGLELLANEFGVTSPAMIGRARDLMEKLFEIRRINNK